MEYNCLVSVVIPVFNAADFFREALDSVLCQTYENLEIIIVDDGSTDGSEKICDEYAREDKRIIVHHQENKGLSAARNRGLDIMTGEAVAFLDADDAYHPDFVKNMINTMVSERCDLVICRYTSFFTKERMNIGRNDQAKPSIDEGVYDRVSALRALVEKRINNHVWNKLYRSQLWESIRFPVGHVYEDIDITFRILDQCEKTFVIDDSLYKRRKHPGAITDTITKNNIENWLLARNHLESFVKKNTPGLFAEDEMKQLMQRKLYHLIDYYVLALWKNEDNAFGLCEYLRQYILELKDEIDIGRTSLYKKIIFRMICSCPYLLRIFYPFYRSISKSLKRIVRGCSF